MHVSIILPRCWVFGPRDLSFQCCTTLMTNLVTLAIIIGISYVYSLNTNFPTDRLACCKTLGF